MVFKALFWIPFFNSLITMLSNQFSMPMFVFVATYTYNITDIEAIKFLGHGTIISFFLNICSCTVVDLVRPWKYKASFNHLNPESAGPSACTWCYLLYPLTILLPSLQLYRFTFSVHLMCNNAFPHNYIRGSLDAFNFMYL